MLFLIKLVVRIDIFRKKLILNQKLLFSFEVSEVIFGNSSLLGFDSVMNIGILHFLVPYRNKKL